METKIFNQAYYYFRRVHRFTLSLLTRLDISEEHKLILCRSIRLLDIMQNLERTEDEMEEDHITKLQKQTIKDTSQCIKQALCGTILHNF